MRTGIPLAARSLPRIAGALLLLAAAGCRSGADREPPAPRETDSAPASAARSAATARAAAKGDRTLRWSTPVHYHGIEVRLELPPGATAPSARIERLDAGDRIVCGDIALSHRFQRFEVTGGGRYHFEAGSRVFIFRPPTASEPWESRSDDLAIVWAGDGTAPVVQEDRRGGVVIWHFGRSRVERGADRSVLHHHGEDERRFRAPVTLLLGAHGELLESRPSVR